MRYVTQRLTCISSLGFSCQCIEKSKHTSVLSWFCIVLKTKSIWGGKGAGTKESAHVWQQFCSNAVSCKCQTTLAVISVEYIFSQTLWEDVCKGNVNKNYCGSVHDVRLLCFPHCSSATRSRILTCGDLRIPVFLHKHRRKPPGPNSDLLALPLVSDATLELVPLTPDVLSRGRALTCATPQL